MCPSRLYLAVLAAGVAVYPLLPGDTARAVLYLALAASGILAVLVGIHRHAPAYRLPWFLAAAGLAVFFTADLVYYFRSFFLGFEGGVSLSDVLYLSSYPLLLAALLLFVRRREPEGDQVSLIDASLVSVSAGLLYWVYLVEPQLGGKTVFESAVMSVAPVMDVLLVAVAVRLLIARGAHPPAFYLAFVGIVALLVTDVLYAWQAVAGAFQLGTVLDEGWLGYYCLWGAAALHPSMRSLGESSRRAADRPLSPVRLAALVVAVLVAPGVLLLQSARGRRDEVPLVALVSILLFLLVLARVVVIVRALAAAAARERTLRSAAAALVGTRDRPGRHRAALDATAALLDGNGLVTRLAVSADGALRLVAAQGGPPAVLGGCLGSADIPLLLGQASSPDPVRRVEELSREALLALGLVGCRGELLVAPVVVQGSPTGVLLAVADRPPPAGVAEALDTLASQLALALEAAALSEALHLRQSEARFHALVRSSSDAILLVDVDTVVQYQSPALERLLDLRGEDLIGQRLLGLVHPEDVPRARLSFREVRGSLGGPAPQELRLRCRDGTWRDVEVVIDDLRADDNVHAVLVTVRDASERKRFERQLRHQAFHDPLTGLSNRALLLDRVEQALGRRARTDKPLAVVVLDLDDFKTVNDSLGHSAGDALLVAVADRLSRLVRPGDTTARLGGDEFALLLDDLPSEDAALLVVERALTTLAHGVMLEGREVLVTASAGVALAAPAEVVTTEELLRNADVAMYVAKNDGKGRLAIYEPQMHVAAVLRLDLRAHLQRAIDNEEFRLLYQPIVSFGSGQLAGVEALVRWQHPERGLLPPAEFLSVTEETGLIVALGEWVLEAAFAQARRWQDAGQRLFVSVNLSQKQLQRPELPERLAAALEQAGVQPGLITLEITESAAMSDPADTVRTLNKLRGLGMRLALDDFGTGYSSLSWLRQLPLDVVKIDKEFVDGVAGPEEDRMLVAAIVGLARNLGLSTVAEGVEHPDQLASLRDLGCDFGQGYLFARPLTADAVSEMFAAGPGSAAWGTSS